MQHRPVNGLQVDDIRRYMVYALEKEGISENTAHSRLNALKFYFEQVLGREKFFHEIPRPKKPHQLPGVFNQVEVANIINSPEQQEA
jgi:integrase/recombinase XerD